MTQLDNVGRVATKLYTEAGMTTIMYHSTEVVQFNDDFIILDSGGWRTLTTKTRMNQASNQFGLGFKVYQEDFDWFVVRQVGEPNKRHFDWDNPIPFEDGMELVRN